MSSKITVEAVRSKLFQEQDIKYRDFYSRLIPDVDISRVIGVRTPVLHRIAKNLSKADGIETFLNDLPHLYYDEYNLHGFIISECTDFSETVRLVDAFLPYVDNWSTCDLLSPKSFGRNHNLLIHEVDRWLASDMTYTVRFGIDMLIAHFLGADFNPTHLEKVVSLVSDEYYVNMAVAWYFSVALAKQWDSTLPYIEGRKLPAWTHNKTIQKAIESRRVPDDRKAYLRTLKVIH